MRSGRKSPKTREIFLFLLPRIYFSARKISEKQAHNGKPRGSGKLTATGKSEEKFAATGKSGNANMERLIPRVFIHI